MVCTRVAAEFSFVLRSAYENLLTILQAADAGIESLKLVKVDRREYRIQCACYENASDQPLLALRVADGTSPCLELKTFYCFFPIGRTDYPTLRIRENALDIFSREDSISQNRDSGREPIEALDCTV